MSRQRHKGFIERLELLNTIQEQRLIDSEMANKFREQEVADYLNVMRENENDNLVLDSTGGEIAIGSEGKSTPNILICYVHQDNHHTDANKCWLDRLILHLTPLGLKEKTKIISDQELGAMNTWHQYIQDQLRIIKVVVLLASPDFLASIYIYNSHFPIFLKEAQGSGLKILPIVLRSCSLDQTDFKHPDPHCGPEKLPLSTLYGGYSSNKPLNRMEEDEQDEFFLFFAQNLLNIVKNQIQTDPNERIIISNTQINSNSHIPDPNAQNSVSDEAKLQTIRENAKGWQTDVKGGSSVYMAETIHIHHLPSKPSD